MRIFHIFDHSLPLHSGYTFRSRAILLEQRRRGWETFHMTTPRHTQGGSDPETVDGLQFYRTKAATGLRAQLPFLSILAEVDATTARLDQVAREHRPEILHAHSPVLNAQAAIRVGKRLGIPVLYEIRGTWEDAAVANGTTIEGSIRYRLSRALETHAIRRVDAVGVICEGLREEFLRRGCVPERLFVVPNAVDVARFTPAIAKDVELEEQLGLRGADVIGFIGSFYDYEGLDILLDAIALLARTRSTVRALLIGGGPKEAALRERTARLGIERHVLMLGRVPQHDVDRYYSLVDILAYPRKRTRVTELVTPLKPLEGMAMCKVIVASDVGGHKELIRPGKTGELFEADNPQSLAQTLDRMFKNRSVWPAYHETGLDYVRRERTWVRTVDNYLPVYKRLTKRVEGGLQC